MKKKILAIEDNEQNLYLIRYILEDCGFEIFSATDGKGGIELAASLLPDAILLDIQLPVMDGYEVARSLRRNPDLADTPIIAVTSYAMPGDKEKAIQSGCSGYIEKPIDPDMFASQVQAYMQKRHNNRGNE
ncbi:MAG TPA: response regulator [Syntrophorhabdaceae bacterium]|nr:response regulator [Syntrophorhabdaceae bacterium]HQM80083.1 response regulator [Syntrophorhabdaceae bacterium]